MQIFTSVNTVHKVATKSKIPKIEKVIYYMFTILNSYFSTKTILIFFLRSYKKANFIFQAQLIKDIQLNLQSVKF